MADEPVALREVPYARLFPWVRLFRCVGIAIDPKKLLLASLGLILLNAGWEGLNRAFPGSSALTPPVWRPREFAYPAHPEKFARDLAEAPWRLTEPARWSVGPFIAVFSIDRDFWTFVHASLAASWGVIVWGIVGGAIARIAAVQLACSERLGAGAALRFSIGKAIPLIGGPLSPIFAVMLFATFGAAFGLLYRLPTNLGPVVAGALLFLPMLAGLTMALILAGLAVGWPLIPSSVAVEADDGFDALSRSYAYVHQRPGHYGAYVALAWAIGVVGLVFVDVFARLVVHLTEWSLSSTAPRGLLGGLFGTAPVLVDPTAATAHAFWLFLAGLLVHGWIYSYFWSSAVIIYFLLRHDVDGTTWQEIRLKSRGPEVPAPPRIAAVIPDPEVSAARAE